MKLSFEGCVFDSNTREVSKDGEAVSLSPKAFAPLEILLRDRPKAFSKEELHEHLWPASMVLRILRKTGSTLSSMKGRGSR